MIDLCTLGTGGAIPMPDRGLASLYVRLQGNGFLIDCGEGTQTAIRRCGWGFHGLQGILLTHYHADHCSGIPGLLLSIAKSDRTEPFHIFGCTGLRRVIDGLMIIAPQLPYEVVLHEFGLPDQHEFDFEGLHITAFPLNHSVPCYGYKVELKRSGKFLPEKAAALGVPKSMWGILQDGNCITLEDGRSICPADVLGPDRKGLSFVYATDTRPLPAIAEYGYHTDLMFLEGMYGDDEKIPQARKNHHMLFREAAALAKDAGTGKLVLTHFSNCIDDPAVYLPNATSVFPQTEAASDLSTYTLNWHGR